MNQVSIIGFEGWAAQVNLALRRRDCIVLLDPTYSAGHWRGFYHRGWSVERMADAFFDWTESSATADGRCVRSAVRVAAGIADHDIRPDVARYITGTNEEVVLHPECARLRTMDSRSALHLAPAYQDECCADCEVA